MIEFVKKFPHKFFGFVGLDPHKGMNAVYELRAAVNDLGMRGAAVDPYLAQIYANDAKYYPIYAKCCELDVPIVFTTGPATLVPGAIIDHVAPRYIDFVARDFPDSRSSSATAATPGSTRPSSWPSATATCTSSSEYESSPMSEAYVQAANTMIGDKILYASAHPFVDFRRALKTYAELPFNPEVRRRSCTTTPPGFSGCGGPSH